MTYGQIRQTLGDETMADFDIDGTIKQAIHLAKGLCARVHETWGPNEGCREFMSAPEMHSCPEKAVHIAVFEEHSQTGIDYVTEQLCTQHALEALNDAEGDHLRVPGHMSCVGFLDMTDDKAHR